MIIKKINIKSIKEAKSNPREIDERSLENLKNSIKEFGYIQPIIWNKRSSCIISGHQRFKILKEEGAKEIEVVEVDLDEKKEKAALIALNKISGTWNYDLLGPLLKELDKGDMLDLTGFDASDLDLMEGLTDTGGIIEEGALMDPMKDGQNHQLIFKFDDEIEMKNVAKFFKSKQYGWKDKNGPNTKQLIKLVEKEKNGK
jgi:ParB-like chromosome segregation protein Spo0J